MRQGVAALLAGLVLIGCLPGVAAAAPPVGCSAQEDGPIKLSLLRSRLWGVAPLAVFFDATDTTADGVARPFHELEYRWDFGDPAGGATWSTGSRAAASSRNSATGPVTAHVFETPGNYTVSVTVDAAKSTCLVSVQDPEVVFADAATACFSTSGNFAGCPAGAMRIVTSNFAGVTDTASGANPVRRLLLRRGEVWSAAAPGRLRAPGPGVLGAFGPPTEARPIVRGTGAILMLSSATTPKFGDWRVMDLEFDGQGGTGAKGVLADGGMNQITLLRLMIHDVDAAVEFSFQILDLANPKNPGHLIWDQMTIADTVATRMKSTGLFLPARRLAVLGSRIEDITGGKDGQHISRFQYIGKGVISNNTLSRQGPGRGLIKMQAPQFSSSTGVLGGGLHTEQVVVSDNLLNGGVEPGAVVSAIFGPVNNTVDNRLRDVIVERNWFRAGSASTRALILQLRDATVRNNLCDMTGGAPGTGTGCFLVQQSGSEPPPARVRFLNNTCYNADIGNFSCVSLDATASSITVQNNLVYAPRAPRAATLMGTGTSGIVDSNNSTEAQIRSVPPGWVSAKPTTPEHFKPGAASPYLDAGVAVPVQSDFFGVIRPRGAKNDIGAFAR